MQRVYDTIDAVIETEGGYSDNPDDSGGPTKYGITLATLRKWRRDSRLSAVDVKNLAKEEARQIYLSIFWLTPRFDRISTISQKIAEELLDTGVNMSPAKAVTFLQRTLNVFNNKGTFYPDLLVDGVNGPKTAEALQSYLKRRKTEGEHVMLFCLDALQAVEYIQIAERREKDESFVYGQILNRAKISWLWRLD